MADDTKKMPAAGEPLPDNDSKPSAPAGSAGPHPETVSEYGASGAPAPAKQSWQDRLRTHRASIAVGAAALLIGGLAGFGIGHAAGDRGEHARGGPGFGRHMDGQGGMGRGGDRNGGPGSHDGQRGWGDQQQPPGQAPGDTPQAPSATPTPSPSAS